MSATSDLLTKSFALWCGWPSCGLLEAFAANSRGGDARALCPGRASDAASGRSDAASYPADNLEDSSEAASDVTETAAAMEDGVNDLWRSHPCACFAGADGEGRPCRVRVVSSTSPARRCTCTCTSHAHAHARVRVMHVRTHGWPVHAHTHAHRFRSIDAWDRGWWPFCTMAGRQPECGA